MRRITTIAVLLGFAGILTMPAWAAKKDQQAAESLGLKDRFVLAAGSSGKCMAKIGGDKLGQQIAAWKCRSKSSSQGFRLKWTDGAWFQIRTARGNLCIEVSGSSKKAGAPVVQWSCTGQRNQHWKLLAAGKQGFLLQARHSGRCLTLDGPDEKVSRYTQRDCQAKGTTQRMHVYR